MDVAVAGVVVAIIALIQGVSVAVINRNQKAQAERDELRQARDACLYELIFSVANACEVLLHSAHGDNVNGNVDKALASLVKAKSECNRVFNSQVARS